MYGAQRAWIPLPRKQLRAGMWEGGDGECRACSVPLLCMEDLQGFTPELKPVFLNAACQQDLQQERGTLCQPSPCSRTEKQFPPVPEADFVLPIC